MDELEETIRHWERVDPAPDVRMRLGFLAEQPPILEIIRMAFAAGQAHERGLGGAPAAPPAKKGRRR